jgi:hypothetical protein
MADTEPELTERQAHLVHALPGTTDDLAEELNIAPSTVRDHLMRVREEEVEIQRDENGVWHLVDESKVRRVSTKHTGTKTREANQYATEMEATILRRLEPKEPLVASQEPTTGHEDVVVHLTDTHMGDVVENERGRDVFNPSICQDQIETFTEKALSLVERMRTHTEFDTCHLLWGGDMLTNENIYDGQAFDIELLLGEQMVATTEALVQQAISFAEEFDTVQVVAQPGNHGKTRASGVSKQANMDLLAYRWIQDRLHDRGVDNVNFLESEATWYRNFEMRGGTWSGHLRHGQDSLVHADATAASSRDWRGWREAHRFDVAYRGHHHQSRVETIMNQYPVIMSPSMKPGSEFAERIGQPDVGVIQKLGTVHGVSDTRPLTWLYVVDNAGVDLPGAPTEE